MKAHAAKFSIAYRGRKTKYYTCSVCNGRFVATTIKQANVYHSESIKAETSPTVPPKLNFPPQSDADKAAVKRMLVYDGTAPAMRTVPVEMTAFMDGELRLVTTPAIEPMSDLLGAVYLDGQNDFQPIPGRCSVSCGDIIVINSDPAAYEKYLILGCGFARLTKEQYDKFMAMPKIQRNAIAMFSADETELSKNLA